MSSLTTGYICHFGGVNSWQKAARDFHSLPNPLKDLALCFLEIFMFLLWMWSQNPVLWLTILLKATKSSFNDQVRFPNRVFTCNYYCEFKFAS